MCGITGICSNAPLSEAEFQLLAQMNNALSHRGPDGDGEYRGQYVALGHRRLSIIDLAGGDQPIYSSDASIVIVFNGEIYNYRELRRTLLDEGYQFTTHSDTEVILKLYEQKGIDCLNDLNGMFAFAIWDNNQKRLFIARDRFGEKPLYYYLQNSKRIAFASELKALVLDPRLDTSLDISAMDDFLAYGYIPAPKSIYRHVRKLPPAHYMVFEQGNLTLQRYWSAKLKPTILASEEEILETLSHKLRHAINLRLRSDVPVGAFLSGGIDSSLIVALASQEYIGTLTTFSVGFTEADFDELRWAKIVAEKYGTDHHEIVLPKLDDDIFPQIVNHFDEPFADPSAIPTYFITREAAQHLKVCLSGDAGDELFCGYNRYDWEPWERVIDTIPARLRKFVLEAIANALPDSFQGKGRLGRFASDGAERWQRKCGPFNAIERLSLFRPEFHDFVSIDPWLYVPYFSDKHMPEVAQRMLADQNTYLSEDILVKVDRTSMWNSLEVRVPFLDHHLVEYVNALPLDIKKKNGSKKYLLKEMLRPLVPEEIITRPKTGFGIPLSRWLSQDTSDIVKNSLLSDTSRLAQYIRPEALSNLVIMSRTGKRDLNRRLWYLVWLETWLGQR